jgi:hypothetical protein
MDASLVPLSKREFIALEIFKTIGVNWLGSKEEAMYLSCSLANKLIQENIKIERRFLDGQE